MGTLVFLAGLTLHAGSDGASAGVSRSVPAAERMLRVGDITIDGADDMGASAVLGALGFHYGDVVPFHRLHEAERRLAGLGLFVTDSATGVRPRITPAPGGGPYTALRVTVLKK